MRLKVGPVIPGAAACAIPHRNSTRAAASTGNSLVAGNTEFRLIWFIVALLVDVDLGHKPAKILGIVGKVIQVRGVEIEHAARWIKALVAGIENHVQRFASAESDRIGAVIQVVSFL